MTSGEVLRETRERKGFDLTTVARRLRIRPDILQAIERGDFSSMPPRGYARNMVNAYARFLGLNPTEIVNMYLDEAYAHQVEKARSNTLGSGFSMDRDSRRKRVSPPRAQRESAPMRTGGAPALAHDAGAAKRPVRHLYDDRTRYSRDDYGAGRSQRTQSHQSDRDFMSHHSGYSSTNFSFLDERNTRAGAHPIRVGQTPMQYSASRLPSFLRSRTALIVLIVVLVAVIAAIVFFAFGNQSRAVDNDVSQLPVSGISDTTTTEEDESAQAATVEVAPTSARIVYTVDGGDQCYIETYENGVMSAAMLYGPVQETVETTGVWTITTWSPGTISVTVNGSPVELVQSEEYGGMSAYTVDFPALLEEWRATHTSRAAQRQAAAASASNASNQEGRTGANG